MKLHRTPSTYQYLSIYLITKPITTPDIQREMKTTGNDGLVLWR